MIGIPTGAIGSPRDSKKGIFRDPITRIPKNGIIWLGMPGDYKKGIRPTSGSLQGFKKGQQSGAGPSGFPYCKFPSNKEFQRIHNGSLGIPKREQ